MTGFLMNLASRVLDPASSLAPLRPSPYEPPVLQAPAPFEHEFETLAPTERTPPTASQATTPQTAVDIPITPPSARTTKAPLLMPKAQSTIPQSIAASPVAASPERVTVAPKPVAEPEPVAIHALPAQMPIKFLPRVDAVQATKLGDGGKLAASADASDTPTRALQAAVPYKVTSTIERVVHIQSATFPTNPPSSDHSAPRLQPDTPPLAKQTDVEDPPPAIPISVWVQPLLHSPSPVSRSRGLLSEVPLPQPPSVIPIAQLAPTAPPAVHITIGRVEVRASPAPPSVARPTGTAAKPALSLADYLNKRSTNRPA